MASEQSHLKGREASDAHLGGIDITFIDEVPDHVDVAVPSSGMKRSVALSTSGVHICLTLINETPNHCLVAFLSSDEQRGVSVAVTLVHISPAFLNKTSH